MSKQINLKKTIKLTSKVVAFKMDGLAQKRTKMKTSWSAPISTKTSLAIRFHGKIISTAVLITTLFTQSNKLSLSKRERGVYNSEDQIACSNPKS